MHGFHFFGMHMIWWIIWIALLVYIFFTPWPIPGEKRKPDSPEYILKQRLARGEISREEYESTMKTLESKDSPEPEA